MVKVRRLWTVMREDVLTSLPGHHGVSVLRVVVVV